MLRDRRMRRHPPPHFSAKIHISKNPSPISDKI
nr:MAG TPA: hypothetical protein [Bacteriophage sp.]